MPLSTLAAELKVRLANPAVQDSELESYITAAQRSVKIENYTTDDYNEQVLDQACHELVIDGKFPEINGISRGGVSTSFSVNDPERYRRRMAARRSASWMNY